MALRVQGPPQQVYQTFIETDFEEQESNIEELLEAAVTSDDLNEARRLMELVEYRIDHQTRVELLTIANDNKNDAMYNLINTKGVYPSDFCTIL